MKINKDGTITFSAREKWEKDHSCAYIKPYRNQEIDEIAIFCKENNISYSQLQQRETMIKIGMRNIPDYNIPIFIEANKARKIWNE